MTPSFIAHFLVYSLISLYASRVVYLIGERILVALRRWYELKQIWNVFTDAFLAHMMVVTNDGKSERMGDFILRGASALGPGIRALLPASTEGDK